MKKLNVRGFTHTIALVAVVVIFAISGVGYLVASHANSSCHSSSTSNQNGHTTTVVQDGCGSACVQTVTINGAAQPSTSCNGSSCTVNGVPSTNCPTPTPAPKPTTRSVLSKQLTGTVTQDGCVSATVAPANCTITITDSRHVASVVQIVLGPNGAKVWGKLYGFIANKDITGKRVTARVNPNNNASVTYAGAYNLGSATAYVRTY